MKKLHVRVAGILCAGGMATAFSIYRLGMITAEGSSTDQMVVFVKVILSGMAYAGRSNPLPSDSRIYFNINLT